jgi:hemerythrin-like metal-binding protein
MIDAMRSFESGRKHSFDRGFESHRLQARVALDQVRPWLEPLCCSSEGNQPMTLLVWDAKYCVNIREIDRQHRKLFDLLNDLYEAMQEGLGKDLIGEALGNLVDYTAYHFIWEEKLFRQHGYAEEAAHRAGHARLTTQLNAMKQKFDDGQTNVTMDMLRYLRDWLNDLVTGEDRKYAPFLIGKGVS